MEVVCQSCKVVARVLAKSRDVVEGKPLDSVNVFRAAGRTGQAGPRPR
jgi:hypothetical protein